MSKPGGVLMKKPYTNKQRIQRIRFGIIGTFLIFVFMWILALSVWWKFNVYSAVNREIYAFGILFFFDVVFLGGLVKFNHGIKAYWRKLEDPHNDFVKVSYLYFGAVTILSIFFLVELVNHIQYIATFGR